MATMQSAHADFRLRRTPEGVRVTIKISRELTESFRTVVGGRQEMAYAKNPETGEEMSFHYFYGTGLTDNVADRDISRLLFAESASGPDGIDVIIPIVRTREQIKRVAESIGTFLREWYEERIRPCDVSVTFRAKAYVPAPGEGV